MRPSTLSPPVVLALLALQCGPSPTLAQDRVEPANAGTTVQAAVDTGARAAALAAGAAYRDAIAQLEARQGSYGLELSEAYVGLGKSLLALDDHAAAAEAFGKALQALRIGYGLNDLRQLPVLRELRAAQELGGNWTELNTTNHLIAHIARHNGDAELRVNALLELGHWLRRAQREKLVSAFDANAGDLATLYEGEIARIEQQEEYAGRNLHLAALYLELAATELAEARRKYALPISDFQTPGFGEQRNVVTQNCFTGLDRSGRPITVCNEPVVVPNMNYYLGPNAQKDQEIRRHLVDAENAVLSAYRALGDEAEASERRTALQQDMQRIAGEYNAFVEENRNQSTPLR